MAFAWGLLGHDIAVDLGTANTLVYVRRKGIVLNEPSVIAINLHRNTVVAVGRAAKRMVGRTPPHIATIRPLKDGVIADLDAAERMLRMFLQKAHPSRFLAKPRVVVAVPSGTTSIEQRAVKEAAYEAGARRVHIIEEPMAAAIGAGLKVGEATGNMVVDIGGGTTEVAIVSMSGVVVARSLRVGGDELDEAIITHTKKEHALLLGDRTAERLKIELGVVRPAPVRESDALPRGRHRVGVPLTADDGPAVAVEEEPPPAPHRWNPFRSRARQPDAASPAAPDEPKTSAPVRGRDLVSGLPKTAVITSEQISEAIEDQVQTIIDAVQATLDQCPAELAGDLLDNGIALTGGGALLRGLADRMGEATGMPIRVVDKPLYSVALGAGRCVDRFQAMRDVLLPEWSRR
ncbi:rod shape-determining protein MreB [Nonomuraea phyllanthi]|uniref:Cell shape-determining protein MreB n=1 Tax=Nonomuraea phyllanthi TaxID=2219224 RepID=A0A5C4WCT9_9ACTN|nr:rod shape-determining protein [Nonomuraea phyllanthi]KAB8193184.1 rod shape-determining protein MreB [Nonomuraea phyllanthi]QFY10954.1 rod shape-determining protein MreB [Nonomuraea phyllanthi]